MTAKTTYVLVRTTPGGQEKVQGPISTVRQATVYAAYVLRDNALVLKSDAQRFSVKLGNAPLDTEVCHEDTGYRFRIETSAAHDNRAHVRTLLAQDQPAFAAALEAAVSIS